MNRKLCPAQVTSFCIEKYFSGHAFAQVTPFYKGAVSLLLVYFEDRSKGEWIGNWSGRQITILDTHNLWEEQPQSYSTN